MRILQVVHGYPPEKWGGVELVTASLAQALAQRGHQVTVFARTADTAAAEFSVRQDAPDTDGVRVVRVVNNLSQAAHFRLEYDHPFLDAAFQRVLTDTRPEVVHVQHVIQLSGSVLRTADQLGYPVVLSLHDFFFACARIHLIDNHSRLCPGPDRGERCIACLHTETTAQEARRRFRYFEQLLHIPQRVIVPSRFLADRMSELFPFLEPRLQVLAPGVMPIQGVRAFSPQAARMAALPEQIQPEDRKHRELMRVLYIGALVPHKGPQLLIQAVRGVPAGSLAVSLYGERAATWNAYADQLEADAADLPIRFCGMYAPDELSTILARHDVLVVPSICEETFSLVTREALQAGLPVIAARRGALPEVIQDGVNGLLFEARERPRPAALPGTTADRHPAARTAQAGRDANPRPGRHTPRIWRPCMRPCGTNRRKETRALAPSTGLRTGLSQGERVGAKNFSPLRRARSAYACPRITARSTWKKRCAAFWTRPIRILNS